MSAARYNEYCHDARPLNPASPLSPQMAGATRAPLATTSQQQAAAPPAAAPAAVTELPRTPKSAKENASQNDTNPHTPTRAMLAGTKRTAQLAAVRNHRVTAAQPTRVTAARRVTAV